VHLAHPLGIKGFTYRRVKNDVRDATDLADLLRMGRLPQAWIAPPATRQLRELVRHRAKLVALRSGVKASVHAVLAKQGLHLPVSDLFGVRGRELLAKAPLDAAYRARVNSLCRVIEALDFEIDTTAGLVAGQLAKDPGYRAIQTIPGVGPVLAAVFVAQIGDVHRFTSARHLCPWAGLTPRHRESDTTVHRGPITKQGATPAALGRHRSRPQAPSHGGLAAQHPSRHHRTPRPQHRHRRGWPTNYSPSSTTDCATGTSAPYTQQPTWTRRDQART
jgi:transposase